MIDCSIYVLVNTIEQKNQLYDLLRLAGHYFPGKTKVFHKRHDNVMYEEPYCLNEFGVYWLFNYLMIQGNTDFTISAKEQTAQAVTEPER